MELHDLIRGKAKQVSLTLPDTYSDIWQQRCYTVLQALKTSDMMSHIDAVVRDCFETVSALILLPCLQMAFAHDSVRVLQCFLQFGSHEQRQLVFEELKGKQAAFAASSTTTFVWCLGNSRKTSSAVPTDDVVTLSKSQYGRHVVKKLLMYGCVHSDFPLLMVWKEECFQNFSQQLRFRLSLSLEFGIFFHVVHFIHSNKELVAAVMQSFKGHVRPMLRHAAASSIIEYAYNDKAVLAQRLMLTEELYGNTFAVCKVRESSFSRIKPSDICACFGTASAVVTPLIFSLADCTFLCC